MRAKRLASAETAPPICRFCCQLKYMPASPMFWRGVNCNNWNHYDGTTCWRPTQLRARACPLPLTASGLLVESLGLPKSGEDRLCYGRTIASSRCSSQPFSLITSSPRVIDAAILAQDEPWGGTGNAAIQAEAHRTVPVDYSFYRSTLLLDRLYTAARLANRHFGPPTRRSPTAAPSPMRSRWWCCRISPPSAMLSVSMG